MIRPIVKFIDSLFYTKTKTTVIRRHRIWIPDTQTNPSTKPIRTSGFRQMVNTNQEQVSA